MDAYYVVVWEAGTRGEGNPTIFTLFAGDEEAALANSFLFIAEGERDVYLREDYHEQHAPNRS